MENNEILTNSETLAEGVESALTKGMSSGSKDTLITACIAVGLLVVGTGIGFGISAIKPKVSAYLDKLKTKRSFEMHTVNCPEAEEYPEE